MAAFYIVLRNFALVDLLLFGKKIDCELLLEKCVTLVFLILKDAHHRTLAPFGFTARGRNAKIHKVLADAFLEEKLKAPKLMSRVELYTELAQFRSECKGIHLLSPSDLPDNTKFQMVFGASNIVDDVKTAIDRAFETIRKILSSAVRKL